MIKIENKSQFVNKLIIIKILLDTFKYISFLFFNFSNCHNSILFLYFDNIFYI